MSPSRNLCPRKPPWELPNLEITPLSGGFHLQETYERIVNIALRNLPLPEEEAMENIVDFSTGYQGGQIIKAHRNADGIASRVSFLAKLRLSPTGMR